MSDSERAEGVVDEQRIEECLNGISSQSMETFAVSAWVVVMERIAEDGTRVLMRLSPSHVTAWARDGMLHQALNTEWGEH